MRYPNIAKNNQKIREEIVYPADFDEHVVEILDSRKERKIDLSPMIKAKLEKGYYEVSNVNFKCNHTCVFSLMMKLLWI